MSMEGDPGSKVDQTKTTSGESTQEITPTTNKVPEPIIKGESLHDYLEGGDHTNPNGYNPTNKPRTSTEVKGF